jgi:hypothetical protein
MLVPPIGKELQTSSTINHISRVIKEIQMLAAHCLFSRLLPTGIQSAVARGKGNGFNTRWSQN